MKCVILTAIAAAAFAAPALAQPLLQFNFGPPPQHGSFWENAPQSFEGRLHLTDLRMQRLHNDGLISQAEWASDHDEWYRINVLAQELPKLEGGAMSEREKNWLWGRLNNLAGRLHWQANLGY